MTTPLADELSAVLSSQVKSYDAHRGSTTSMPSAQPAATESVAAHWLADTMCARGTPLKAGDVMMTGALGPMHPLSGGETVVADLGDLGAVVTYLQPRQEDP